MTGVSVDELAATYPRLYHVTSEGAWTGIEWHGLLSAQALADLFEIRGESRERLLAKQRPQCVPIEHARFGKAIIRDQKPLVESRLRTALQDGMTPREWYTLLNGKVFFWVAEARCEVLRNANAYQGLRQTVLVVDTAALLASHSDQVTLCPMNSGNCKQWAWPRGRRTFLPMSEYPYHERKKKGGLKSAVVELAVEYDVPDIRGSIIRVVERGGGKPDRMIYEVI